MDRVWRDFLVPGVWARVYEEIDWIQQTMAKVPAEPPVVLYCGSDGEDNLPSGIPDETGFCTCAEEHYCYTGDARGCPSGWSPT